MASQGPFLVGTGASIPGGGVDWSDPGGITASGGLSASVVLSAFSASDLLAGTDCGFTLPATPTGIVVELKDFAVSGTTEGEVILTKDGSSFAGLSEVLTPVAGWQAYGSASSLWGTTWTAGEANADTFGAMALLTEAAGEAATVTLDAVRVTVHYEPPPAPGGTIGWFSRYLRLDGWF